MRQFIVALTFTLITMTLFVQGEICYTFCLVSGIPVCI